MFLINAKDRDEGSVNYTLQKEDFRTLAIKGHGDQKYGNFPYSIHLAMVEEVLVHFGFDSFHYRAAAWLHDIIEDTKMTPKAIQRLYGNKVALMVLACTGTGSNRKERNKLIYERLQALPEAAPVKLADRFVNTNFGILTKSPKLKMYVDEFEEFASVVKPLMIGVENGAHFWNHFEDVNESARVLLGIDGSKVAA